MENKILTVSIAAFIVEQYMGKALNLLIIEKSFNDLEIIVVDDGSYDATSTIVERYVRKYPNVFRLISKENGGYGSTINVSVEVASGKYFKQLDGDDWFEKDNLSEFVEFLKSSNADCIYSPYWKVYQDDHRRELKESENVKPHDIAIKDHFRFVNPDNRTC